jgi:hypothetical protein
MNWVDAGAETGGAEGEIGHGAQASPRIRLSVLTIAQARGINLASLPRKKSACDKLTLAAAMKDATSVSLDWLAQWLQMGATASVSSLLTRFRAHNSELRT